MKKPTRPEPPPPSAEAPPPAATVTTDCGFPVHCRYSALVDIETLRPHPANDNRHSKEQIDALARILSAKGWRAPIVVSTRSGFIVAGEGRWRAARKAGALFVPVDFQAFPDEAEELRHLTADNATARLAQSDAEQLATNVQSLDDLQRQLTGLTEKMLADALAAAPSTTAIRELPTRPLPRYSWVLIGVPLSAFGPVQSMLDALHPLLPPDAVLEVSIGKGPEAATPAAA